jgi:2-dehydropantoate 2-reductase
VAIAVYGAGAVGLVVGARLARAGSDVLFITRRREVAELIESDGVRCQDLVAEEAWLVRTPAVAGIRAAAERLEGGPVLFCMRRSETAEAASALARTQPRAIVASLQNDVDNEEILARHFATVIGGVYRQTCTRTAPNSALAAGAGRVVLGMHPRGTGPDATSLAAAFRAAGYDVGLSPCIARDLWLKLCVNLMSAPNALVRREDHETRAFIELKVRLLEEAKEVLAAAGIEASSCDGRDRSLDGEIAFQRAALERGTSARRLPLYNQVWSSLEYGSPLEADGYHRRVLDLAARHGLSLPQNERILAALTRAARDGLGPESAAAEEILADS